MTRVKTFLKICLALLTLIIIVVGAISLNLNAKIQARFAEKRFAPPLEFYSAPQRITAGTSFSSEAFGRFLSSKNYRTRKFQQPLQNGDFSLWSAEECLSVLNPVLQAAELTDNLITECISFRPSRTSFVGNLIFAESSGALFGIFQATEDQTQRLPFYEMESELFAQYYGDAPILRNVITLGQVPVNCLNALMAIEDSQFFEHQGVSIKGIGRAFYTNLRAGKVAQGGSTLTQQLVKNYFLTPERTISRKLKEFLMAILIDSQFSKDEILETYINLIYMGQNGPFQVRGFSSASQHYFGRNLEDLNLSQCALLAALVNSPGLYSPFTKPLNATKRRTLVLERMLELNQISIEQKSTSEAEALPKMPARPLQEPAPYYVQAVLKQLRAKDYDLNEGLKIYTGLNLLAQDSAQKAVEKMIPQIEERFPLLKKLKAQKKYLQTLVISADVSSGHIQALVGGRDYKNTQFNRAYDSRRQVGSLMKPFVYLTAFEEKSDEREFTALSPLPDKKFTYKNGKSKWTPHNYDGKYLDTVPVFYALQESINVPTAQLGIEIGIDTIIDQVRELGISTKLEPYPSLTLGAFELAPIELLQAYTALARMGQASPISMITKITKLDGQILFEFKNEALQAVKPETAAQVVSIMEAAAVHGTGRSAALYGIDYPFAGKTGTTNDYKDSWFVGFTPDHVALVWVGYDDNTVSKLSGASGALPIWATYMQGIKGQLSKRQFAWPNTMEERTINSETIAELGFTLNKDLAPTTLMFETSKIPEAIK